MRRRRFDDVRVERPLHEKARVLLGGPPRVLGRILEDIDERVADASSLLLGVADACERGEKSIAGVDGDQIDAEVRAKRSLDLIALVETKQSSIDEDAGELIADRAMHEGGSDRRVHTARESTDHARRPDLLSDLLNLTLDECASGPRRLRSAHLEEEVGDHLPTPRGMRHLRMELYSEHGARAVPHAGDLHRRAAGRHLVTGRWRLDVVSMTHPHGDALAITKPIEEPVGLEDLELGASILSRPWRDFAALEMGDELHPVADPKHGCDVEQRWLGAWTVVIVHRARPPAENDSSGLPFSNPLERAGGRMNLRVYARLTNAPGNELGELRAVVENENPATHGMSTPVPRDESPRGPWNRDRGSRRSAGRTASRTPRPD